jgi:hypothetical protein
MVPVLMGSVVVADVEMLLLQMKGLGMWSRLWSLYLGSKRFAISKAVVQF